MQNSLQAYTQKYDENNYGLLYPDSHVIRFYERILKYKLSITVEIYLILVVAMEFIKYFLDKGFKPFGIDIVPSLQKNWDAKIKTLGGRNCKIIEPNSSSKGFLMKKWILSLRIKAFIISPKQNLNKISWNFMNA